MVVALERGEDIGVAFEGREPVFGEVASAAAGLAAFLDRAGGVPCLQSFETRGTALEFALMQRIGFVISLQCVHPGDELVLCELVGVGTCDQWQQPALMHPIIHDDDFFAVARRELFALEGVAAGDAQGDLRGRAGRTADADPAAYEGAEHREEPAVYVVDGRRIGAVVGDVAVAVEEIVARNTDVVEHDAAVVDAGKTALVAAVRRRHAGHVLALGRADRHDETMHAVALAPGEELGKHRRRGRMFCRTTDVVLA